MKKSNYLLLILLLFGFGDLHAQVTAIPDTTFEQWLINNNIDTDGLLNHQVATADISSVTELNTYSINDFTGIQDFTALENLNVIYSNATSINLSTLTHLKSLELYGNSLNTIDLSHNLELTNLNLGNSGNLKTLDISVNTALIKLQVNGYKLTTLDLSHNSALTDISLGSGLINLNIANGNNHNVTRFWAANCNLLSCVKVDAGLDTSGTISDGDGGFVPIWQTYSDDDGNHITTFSETDCGVYTAIPDVGFEYYLTQNGITVSNSKVLTSDISGITNIDLTGDYNPIGDFTGIQDFTALTYFKYNRGGQGVFSSIDLSQNTNLTFLEIKGNDNLTTIDISKNTKLQELNITDGALTKLDISKNPLVTKLSCYGNPNLTVLNLKGRADQTAFEAGNSFNSNLKLSCIEVDDIDYATTNWLNKDVTASYYTSGCPSTAIPDRNFEQVLINNGYDDVIDGKVITANIAGVTNLSVAYTTVEDITGIEDFVSLKDLTVYYTGLKKVDLSHNKALESINFGYNNLKSFDLSQNTALKAAYISDNILATLDFHNNPNLEDVFLGGPLLNLNMANGHNEKITRFSSQNCNLLSCVKVDNLAVATGPVWLTNGASNTVFSETACTQYTAIPDANFEQALIDNVDENGVVTPLDTIIDGKVLTSNINTIAYLDVQQKNITNLTGIQDFVALTYLEISNNVLTSPLDVSKNINLNQLNLYGVGITTLDVSKNINLTNLSCDGNQLTTLDVSNNTALQSLICSGNQLTTLDVSKNAALIGLFCNDNQLTALDVSKNTNLNNLYCGENQLTTLNVEGLTANQLAIWGSSFVDNPNLTCVKVSPEYLADFNNTPVGNANGAINKDATTSYCTDYTLIVNPAFEQYLISNVTDENNNPIDDVVDGKILTSKVLALRSLYISAPHLSDANDVKIFTELESLYVVHNADLNTIDISKNTKLINLIVDGLMTLDVSKNTKLTYLNCNNSPLTSLNLSQNTALTEFNCANNQLTSLDLSHNTALVYLNCTNNQFASLNLSANTSLEVLICNNNLLSSLDVSQNIALSTLYCYSNQLTSLDLSKNTSLVRFNCQNNQLTTVDLRNGNNTNLHTFINNDKLSANKKTTVSYPIGIFGFQANDPALVILVDNKSYSDTNWMAYKDASAVYLENVTLGTGDNTLENVSITPNPTQGELYINNIVLEKVTVFSLLGNVVKTINFGEGNTTNVVDLSNLTAGLYLVKISSNGLEKTVKVLKK